MPGYFHSKFSAEITYRLGKPLRDNALAIIEIYHWLLWKNVILYYNVIN